MKLNVAVITLTRDRLDYTKHCFATLREHAGCDYDHFIVDQASGDDTVDWLDDQDELDVTFLNKNIGICAGINLLLDEAVNPHLFDLIVRYDNDCEVTQPDTLRTVCEVALEHNAIVAPHVHGLMNPPVAIRQVTLGHHTLSETQILGGIFMAIPARLFTDHGYRYDEHHQLCTGDEAIVPWWRTRGGLCGYLDGFTVNHYETTAGQISRYPDYHSRKIREMAA